MTRPIYEPTMPRNVSSVSYATRQLLRRPDPSAAAGIVPWARLKFVEAEQSIDAGGETIQEYDDYCNFYPTYFDINTSPTTYGLQPLIPGLYQITGRCYNTGCGDSFPNSGYELNLKGVDWDEWTYYSRFISGDSLPVPSAGVGFNTSLAGYIEVTTRLGPTTDIGQSVVYMEVVKGADAVCAGPGTYLEMRFLAADPYWPDGLDTDAYECTS